MHRRRVTNASRCGSVALRTRLVRSEKCGRGFRVHRRVGTEGSFSHCNPFSRYASKELRSLYAVYVRVCVYDLPFFSRGDERRLLELV